LRLVAAFSGRDRSRSLRRLASASSIAGSLITRFAWVQAGHASAKNYRLPLELPEKASGGTLTSLPSPS